MNNLPRDEAEDGIDYFNFVYKQIEEMQSDPGATMLTLLVPSKHLVDSGKVDFSSWPQLREAYANFPQDSSPSPTMMVPTFLRVVADLVDKIHEHQHANTQNQPQYIQNQPQNTQNQPQNTQNQPQNTQNPSNFGPEWATNRVPQMNVGGAGAYFESSTGAEVQTNPAVPASNFLPAVQGPATRPDLYAGLLTPPHLAHRPNPSVGTPQPLNTGYPPMPSTEGSKQPVNAATSFHSRPYDSLTATYPAHQSNPSSHAPSEIRPVSHWPAARPNQFGLLQASHFDASRPASAHNSPALSSVHHGHMSAADESTGSGAPPNNPHSGNPFARSVQTSAASMASRQRSLSSASYQSYAPSSVASPGSVYNDLHSARIPGRRPMGQGLRMAGFQNSSAPTGGTENSSSTNNQMEMGP